MNSLPRMTICKRKPAFCNIPRRHKHREIYAGHDPKLIENDPDVSNRNNRKLFPSHDNPTLRYNSILPPPNVTGNLHLGHALMATVQDVICRWKLKNGIDVNIVPGTDHAGIATQVVVEQLLKKQRGVSRYDIGRTEFLREVWKWKEEKGNRIKDDLQKLGTIFNWEQEYFTLDKHQSFAVAEAFIRLFETNLIYRKEALVNWSCALESTISDIEIEMLNIDGPTKVSVPDYSNEVTFGEIFDISYAICNGDGEIVVSTTRPETLLGDVAVAVNPNDYRYAEFYGEDVQLWHPIRNEPIPLIFDEFADPSVGTGAVKITPAHNKEDYEVAQRHKLQTIPVINEKGLIVEGFAKYSGQRRFDARETILDDLSNLNLFRQKTAHKLQLPICSRSKDVIEYLLKPQWFLDCSNMSRAAIEVVDNGSLLLDPPRFEKIWKHWLSSNLDWCLSRQLWWGHQIPAFECKFNNKVEWLAAHNREEAIEKAKTKFGITKESGSDLIEVKQDEDVLDTWFSSGILPFSVFGWPEKKNISKSFPLDILVTGHDIIFFWVIRMVMLSMQLTGQVPFAKVLLHGVICDSEGRKMSKSRGNVITPEQIIRGASFQELKEDLKQSFRDGIFSQKELVRAIQIKENTFPKGIPECGVDALRFTLCNHDIREHYIDFNVQKCHANKLFFNKIWNATKFTLNNCQNYGVDATKDVELIANRLSDMDKWILSRLASTLNTTKQALNEYNFHAATEGWKQFFYDKFCNVYLEAIKVDFEKKRMDLAHVHCEVLKTCLVLGLQDMSVVTPYLANELLNFLPATQQFQIDAWVNRELETDVEEILNICTSVRSIKTDNNITRKKNPKLHLFSKDPIILTNLEKFQETINRLTFSAETVISSLPISQNEFTVKSTAGPLCTFGVLFDGVADIEKVANFNRRKLSDLEDELIQRLEYVSPPSYHKRAKPETKKRHLEEMRRILTETKILYKFLK